MRNSTKAFGALALLLAAGAVFWTVRSRRRVPSFREVRGPNQSPLYEAGDRPTTVFLKGLGGGGDRLLNVAAVIRLSKIRANQMKQTVLAYLSGSQGQVRLPVPEGLALNEFYVTPAGTAVVDLSTDQVAKNSVGFFQEALFIRGLIDSLTDNFGEIKEVRVLVDGQDAPTLLGHYALGTSEPSLPVSISANEPVF
jgi:Sporulation and spore germination